MNQSTTNNVAHIHPSLDSVKETTNRLLEDFYNDNLTRANNLHPLYGRLWSAMLQNHRAGGKRLRPYVMTLTYSGLGGRDYKTVAPAAVALELLHTCLLAHDDIIDQDYVRHGKPNIAGQYQQIYKPAKLDRVQNSHYANSAALLAGDLLLMGAYRLIDTSQLNGTQKTHALELLSEALFIVAGGELLDTEAAFLPFERADSLGIANLKTAHYSFVTPFKMGAALAGADAKTTDLLTQVGELMGVAYQMTDDLLGIFGDEAVTGKSTTSDLAGSKHTHLIELGMKLADTEGRKLISTTLGDPIAAQNNGEAIRTLLVSCGAKTAVEELIETSYAQAKTLLGQSDLDTQAQKSLTELLARLVRRES